MLQVKVVTSANRHLFADSLDEYFHWRYKIYVQSKRWCAENESEREIDQFDHDDAFHFLGFRNGEFVAGTRLMPSSGPTLLRDVFPRLPRRAGFRTGPSGRTGRGCSRFRPRGAAAIPA